MQPALVFCFVAYLACLCVTPLIRNACIHWNVIDYPDLGRKRHNRAVPRLGGIAVVLGFSICLSAALFLSNVGVGSRLDSNVLLIFAPLFSIFLIGLYDDLHGLLAGKKLLLQIGVAAIAVSVGFHFTLSDTDSAPLKLGLSMFWLVACMNAFNLIDGLDGFSHRYRRGDVWGHCSSRLPTG